MVIEAPAAAGSGSAVAPWELVAPDEQLFVLITGANRYDIVLTSLRSSFF
jgi:3-keto steroid reductase